MDIDDGKTKGILGYKLIAFKNDILFMYRHNIVYNAL